MLNNIKDADGSQVDEAYNENKYTLRVGLRGGIRYSENLYLYHTDTLISG